MSKWAVVQKLPEEIQERVRALYNHEQFPYEVRTILALWIEEKPWDKIEPDNPEHETFAETLVGNLILELSRSAISNENSIRYKLEHVMNYYTSHFSHDPMNLVRIYQRTLQSENNIVQTVSIQYKL